MSLQEGCDPISHRGGKILNLLRSDIGALLVNSVKKRLSGGRPWAKLHYLTLK